MVLWDEIQQQPTVLAGMLESNRSASEAIAEWLAEQDISYVVIAARGTSDNAARYAQYLWGARNRMPVALAAPSLFGSFQSPPRLDHALVVGISESGQSPDLVAVLDEARRQGRPTLAITNHRVSPMAVAATKTFTTQLLAVAMLSAALGSDREMVRQLALVPTKITEVLARSETIDAVAEKMANIDRCVVLGRGYHHATAHEWALKLQELAYLVAHPYSTADFRHGPLAIVEPGLPVLAVATEGTLYEDVRDLLIEVRGRGAEVVAISDRADCPADHLITIPGGLPERLHPIEAIVAAQLFTYHLSLAKGIDPDRPRGLRKVTRTR